MASNPQSLVSSFIPLVLILFVFYFLVMRPQYAKQKEFKRMINNIAKNDEVVTIGGIHGTVVLVKDKTVILRIDENVKVELDKTAIARIEKKQA